MHISSMVFLLYLYIIVLDFSHVVFIVIEALISTKFYKVQTFRMSI